MSLKKKSLKFVMQDELRSSLLFLYVSMLSILFSDCLLAVWQICGVSFATWPLLQDKNTKIW